MAKQKQKSYESVWWWTDGKKADSNGIFRWYPLFNSDERGSKINLKLCQTQGVPGESFIDYRITPPNFDYSTEEAVETQKAKNGHCLACGATPKKVIRGRSKGMLAYKCGKCEHMWRIAGTSLARTAPTSPSEAPQASSGTEVPKKKAKKAQKAKGKGGKRKAKP